MEINVGPPLGGDSRGPADAGIASKLEWLAPRADELLWKKLNLNRALLNDLEQKATNSSGERKERLRRCRSLLDEARTCLTEKRRLWNYGRNSDMFWAAIHHADEELVMLMDAAQLEVVAINVKDDVNRSPIDSSLRTSWLGLLPDVITNLPKLSPSEGPRLQRYRQLVRGAQHEINDKTDRKFWQLAMNTRVRVWSAGGFLGIMLIVLLCSSPLYALLRGDAAGVVHKIFGMMGLFGLGAASAILSNMLYGQKINVPYGPTQTLWAVFYYMVVVPLVGAASGALLAGLARSEILFSFEKGSMRPIVIAIDQGARPFAYMVIVSMGGFLGERVLRGAFGKVYEAMFRDADKDSRPPNPSGDAKNG